MTDRDTMTFYAPAERAPIHVIDRQTRSLGNSSMIGMLFDCVNDMVVILNPERQIVFANGRFMDLLGEPGAKEMFGKRPGEAIGCIHALDPAALGGCGTTEFCRTCGAVNAILNSQNKGTDVQECSIVLSEESEALNLRVRTTQLDLEDEEFTVFAIEDVSHEKRRAELERIFFHDILNTAGILRGMAEMLEMLAPEKRVEFSQRIHKSADRLIDEINSQRIIVAAERNELSLSIEKVNALDLLMDLVVVFDTHRSLKGRHLVLGGEATECILETDKGLLSRVILNMIKNGLEASPKGETVTVSCRPVGDAVRFDVHNTSVMARNVALQVFRRSFSTKGKGRGLGTYSMRLLGEKYLKGKIEFVSEDDTGTVFSATFPMSFKGN